MEILNLVLSLVAIFVAGFSIMELRHDAKLRREASKELAVALKEQGNAMVALSGTHNDLVTAQQHLNARIESAEYGIQAIKNQVPMGRRL